MKHVILGAGPAGVIAAETIRKHAPDDDIVIVGDEPEAPYSRMAIPYLLMGNIGEDGTHLRHTPGHFEKLSIASSAAARQGRRHRRAHGRARRRQHAALRPPADRHRLEPGQPADPRHRRRRRAHLLDAAGRARDRAARHPGARVLQMGAGFIGCIIMEALAARGVQLTVVEMGDRMVPRMMGPTAGGMIKDWCEKKGVRVFTGTRVEAIEPRRPRARSRRSGLRVRLSNGQHLEADLVISATGVKPNIGFLENSGITCLLGVLTDEHLQTSVPGIYAAGDCAEAFDKISGKTIVSAIQPNAAEQARVAALNMVGRKAELRGVTQINVLDTLGLISTSFGDWQGVPGGEHVELTDRAAGRHLSLQFNGDALVGCNSIGWTDHVGVMRGLVEGQVRLGDWKTALAGRPDAADGRLPGQRAGAGAHGAGQGMSRHDPARIAAPEGSQRSAACAA